MYMLNHQIWAAILLSIVLMTPVICGRLFLEDSYENTEEDTESYNNQREQLQQRAFALNIRNILMRHLRSPVEKQYKPLKAVPCYFKLCPMGKRSVQNYWNN